MLPKQIRAGLNSATSSQRWACCAEERKSRKFIYVAPQRKLWPSKAQLRSLCLKHLDAPFNRNFILVVFFSDFWILRCI
jgi:hypothetical protein